MFSCKMSLRKTDKNMESFLKTAAMVKKPLTVMMTPTVHVLDKFPVKNIEELRIVERKLKKKTFHLQVVRYFIFLLHYFLATLSIIIYNF